MSILSRDLVSISPQEGLDVPAETKYAMESGLESLGLPGKAWSLLKRTQRKLKQAEKHFDALRLRVVASEPRRANRNDAIVVALTSRTRGEGASTVALALARTFARNGDGRVLLIDSDEVSNDLARRAPAGAATILQAPEDLNSQDEVLPVPAWDVDLLALASSGNGDGLAMNSPQWEDYFSAMRARYDVIVVDAGSIHEGALQFWASVSSQILLVVDTTRTTVQALERLAKDLKTSKLAMTGVVLNKREYPIPQFLY